MTNTKIPTQKDNHMFKKTITFTDYAGNEKTEDHFFNLNKAELFELELLAGDEPDKGLTETISRVAKDGKPREIISLFKMIIEKSYGTKSEDGTRFIKSDKVWEEFSQSEAYSEIYFELVTNAGAASAFVRGIMPKEIQDRAEFLQAQRELADMDPRERSEALMQGYKKPVEKREEATPEEQRKQDRAEFERDTKVDGDPLPSAPVQDQSAGTPASINGLDLNGLTNDQLAEIVRRQGLNRDTL